MLKILYLLCAPLLFTTAQQTLPCQSGSVFNTELNRCQQCPAGKYSQIFTNGYGRCQDCPNYRQPSLPGSSSINDCPQDNCQIIAYRNLYTPVGWPQYNCENRCYAGTYCCPTDLSNTSIVGRCVPLYNEGCLLKEGSNTLCESRPPQYG